MKYFVDANVFIRFFVKDNPRMYKDCFSFITRVQKKNIPMYTSHITIMEIFWVLTKIYDIPRHDILPALRSLASIPSLHFTENFDLPLALDLATHYTVKMADCLLASHKALQNGTMVMVSYDTDFDTLRIKRVEPK